MRSILPFLVWLSVLFLAGCASGASLPAEDTGTLQTPIPAVPSPSMEPIPSTPVPSPAYTLPVTEPLPAISLTPQPTIEPVSEQTPTLPVEHVITGLLGHRQYFPLGCEASVAVDWAAFFGVAINEFEFQTQLPLSDNPEFGFVGSVDGPWGQVPPYAYGVHAAPVAALLQTYGLNAQAVKGYTLQEIKQQIAMDHPVIAWVIGNVVGGIPYDYVDSEGNTTVVAAYEHVIIVIGYSQGMIRYNNNGKVYEIPTEIFENSWSVLGNMALVMGVE